MLCKVQLMFTFMFNAQYMNPYCWNVTFTDNVVCSLETFLQLFFSNDLLRVQQMPIFWRTHFVSALKNLGLRMCIDTFFMNEFFPTISSSSFPLANATFEMFAKDVTVTPIKHQMT